MTQNYSLQHFVLNQGLKPPAGEVYAHQLITKGELGFYIKSDGKSITELKVGTPLASFMQLYLKSF